MIQSNTKQQTKNYYFYFTKLLAARPRNKANGLWRHEPRRKVLFAAFFLSNKKQWLTNIGASWS
jgi:hypothetical protein